MATQVETLLHTSNSTPLTPDLTPEPGSKQADDDTVEDKKELREAPPPKVNPWTKKPNSVTVNGQTAPERSVTTTSPLALHLPARPAPPRSPTTAPLAHHRPARPPPPRSPTTSPLALHHPARPAPPRSPCTAPLALHRYWGCR
ncbi:la-related protein 1 isoform X1 [Tachysurus ichikawai]